MNPIIQFLKNNSKGLILGFLGILFGIFLSYCFDLFNNKRLLDKLTAELELLQNKDINTLTQDEKEKIGYLKGEIYILKFQC